MHRHIAWDVFVSLPDQTHRRYATHASTGREAVTDALTHFADTYGMDALEAAAVPCERGHSTYVWRQRRSA